VNTPYFLRGIVKNGGIKMAKKLLEYTNEEALERLADIIEPISEIASDKRFRVAFKGSRINAIKVLLKHHKSALIDILAIYEGIPREEFSANVVQIITMALRLFSDEEIMSVFTSLGQNEASST
jgi:hypothetical protein